MASQDKGQEPRKKKGKAEETEVAQTPSGRRLPLKLIAAVLVLGLLGGGGYFAWSRLAPAEHEAEASASTEGGEVMGQTYRPNQFIVNLIDPLGRRYLKVQLELEMENPAAVEEAGKRDAQIRDSVITLLSSKTYGDIDSPEGKLQLRREIIARVNQFLHSGKAINAYFTDFVVQ